MDRGQIARHISARLRADFDQLQRGYQATCGGVGHLVIDGLLPDETASAIACRFPCYSDLTPKRDMRERKAVSAQMNRHAPLIEEALFAFQDREVVSLIGAICDVKAQPDPMLYAGGISAMRSGDFLSPHLDNSHDRDRSRWRVLNLLFYVSRDWSDDAGGSLELWPNGVSGQPISIASRFNRLVVMATHDRSWHSVSPVVGEGERRCISNYYFANEPLRSGERAHVTTFRGRPEQPLRNIALRADASLREAIRAAIPSGLRRGRHEYHTSSTPPVTVRMPDALTRPAIE